MDGDIQGAFLAYLYFADYRAGSAVAFRLVERLGKGFLRVSAVFYKLRFQRLVQQSVAFGLVVAVNTAGLIQLQLGERPFCDNKTLGLRGGTAYRLLVRGAGDLALRHTGDEQRAQRHLRVAVEGQADTVEVFRRVIAQAALKLFPKLRPGVGEAVDDLARFRVNLNGVVFMPLVITAYLLNHTVRRAGDDERVHRVVQVAVCADLAKSPALAKIRRHRAVDRRDPLFPLFRGGKLQIIVQIIQHEAGHGPGILQIALDKLVEVCIGYCFLQQIGPFFIIAHAAVDPYDEVITPFARQVLQGQAVALVAVLL